MMTAYAHAEASFLQRASRHVVSLRIDVDEYGNRPASQYRGGTVHRGIGDQGNAITRPDRQGFQANF